jgi:hypothetical protein
MRYRIAFLGGLAAGFVLGARAGRERYEQIKGLSQRVTDSPAAQQAAGALQAQAAGLAKAAQERVTNEWQDRAPKVAAAAKSKAADRIPGLRRKTGGRHGDGAGNGSGSYTSSATREHGTAPDR